MALVVFDFDHTLIPVDSDRHVLETLGGTQWPEIKEMLLQSYHQRSWTKGMDNGMKMIHENGISRSQVIECLETIIINPELKQEIIRLSSQGVDFRILSDANTVFINAILRKNGLDNAIPLVVSNPAQFDDHGRLHIKPYHTDPHPAASRSPPNLCKGRVMETWLAEKPWTKVTYCGDGSGDFEGAMRVPAAAAGVQGRILARQDFDLLKDLTAKAAAAAAATADDPPRRAPAPVVAWRDWPHLAALLAEFHS